LSFYIKVYFFGGNSEEETPVPIPNTEVKLFSADGTAWEAKWESRTPPKNLYISPESVKTTDSGLFCASQKTLTCSILTLYPIVT
jgi:hypothetical protein